MFIIIFNIICFAIIAYCHHVEAEANDAILDLEIEEERHQELIEAIRDNKKGNKKKVTRRRALRDSQGRYLAEEVIEEDIDDDEDYYDWEDDCE